MNFLAKSMKRLMDWRHSRFVAGGNRFRENRLRFFADKLVNDGDIVLDVGYGYGQFEQQMLQMGMDNDIIGLDIAPRKFDQFSNVKAFVVADASYLPFADRSLGVIYCNSILEHLESWKSQQLAFEEIRRVGIKFFVQTPNQHFPIEAHHLVPFFQYFPKAIQKWIGENLLGHYEHVELLDKRAVRTLSGSDEKILVFEEKVFGLIKSFVLYRQAV